ncbi:hypothetical protein SAMN04489758_101100 [Thomasclavelia cocleata]|uniref:Uncharacterized protein n=1 Tax=Thomasclavelia cocleata TaxID=69824 RepID=A0A1I0BFB9_9FIRM|nr:hypothetical protein SAMN04489758_101100 [Thomasclavelia cocleata]
MTDKLTMFKDDTKKACDNKKLYPVQMSNKNNHN